MLGAQVLKFGIFQISPIADIGPLARKTVWYLSPDDQERIFPLLKVLFHGMTWVGRI